MFIIELTATGINTKRCPVARCIRGAAFETYLKAVLHGSGLLLIQLIFENKSSFIDIIDHQVQVTIIIQVSVSCSVGKAWFGKTPVGGLIAEFYAIDIAESIV